jgi:excisionase family DNA binding protein
MGDVLTTTEAAKRLGLSAVRVRALCEAGELPARKVGRDWLIELEAIVSFERKPPGWPRGRPRRPEAS